MVDCAGIGKTINHTFQAFDHVFFLDDLRLEYPPVLNISFVDIVEDDLLLYDIDDCFEMVDALIIFAEKSLFASIFEVSPDIAEATFHNIIIFFKS